MNEPDGDGWIGTRSAARYLDCSPRHVRDLARAGAIPAARLGGELRFRRADLDRALTAGEQEADDAH